MNGSRQRLPRARKSELVIVELPNEVLVYDYRTAKAHCLNFAASLVWANCDGLTTIAEMTELLQKEMKVPLGDEVIWLALDQLRQARLLEEPFARPPQGAQISRRILVKRLSTAAVALPLIISLTAPTAAAAATCGAAGAACTSDADCCSNSCVDNGRGGFECT
jgi:hypothetical protein